MALIDRPDLESWPEWAIAQKYILGHNVSEFKYWYQCH